MTRDEALAYLQSEYAEITREAGFESSQELRAYSLVIDHALRTLGYAESALATVDTDEEDTAGYLAALDYFALSRLLRTFALRTDVSLSGTLSASQSQAFKQLTQLRDEASARLTGLGFSTTNEMQVGRFTLDFIEPAVEGAW